MSQAVSTRPERQAFYDRIGEHSLAPLWESLHALVTNTPTTPCSRCSGITTTSCGRT